jgi:recA bacterial DNA recombination protein
MPSIATVRAQVESRLGPRDSAAFDVHVRPPVATIPTGIEDIDRMLGGIPVGAITELVAPPFISAGQKSIQAQLLARATQEQLCALVDATDSFDPKSAQAIGVDLQRLLWVRCSGNGMKSVEQAFQCADLLLQASGGFGAIIVDLAGRPACFVRKVPLTTWFRFRAVIEKQETALVFSTPHAVTSTCSELVLALSTQRVQWSQATALCPTHARVFAGFDFKAEITRKRSFKRPVQPGSHTLRCYPRLV